MYLIDTMAVLCIIAVPLLAACGYHRNSAKAAARPTGSTRERWRYLFRRWRLRFVWQWRPRWQLLRQGQG
jgi:hypothetical protein